MTVRPSSPRGLTNRQTGVQPIRQRGGWGVVDDRVGTGGGETAGGDDVATPSTGVDAFAEPSGRVAEPRARWGGEVQVDPAARGPGRTGGGYGLSGALAERRKGRHAGRCVRTALALAFRHVEVDDNQPGGTGRNADVERQVAPRAADAVRVDGGALFPLAVTARAVSDAGANVFTVQGRTLVAGAQREDSPPSFRSVQCGVKEVAIHPLTPDVLDGVAWAGRPSPNARRWVML